MTAVACVSMWRVGDGAKAGDTLSYIQGNSAVTAETDSKKSTGVGSVGWEEWEQGSGLTGKTCSIGVEGRNPEGDPARIRGRPKKNSNRAGDYTIWEREITQDDQGRISAFTRSRTRIGSGGALGTARGRRGRCGSPFWSRRLARAWPSSTPRQVFFAQFHKFAKKKKTKTINLFQKVIK